MSPCSKCNAACCRYITTIITEPKDSEDWDEIKWMLLHKGVMVYIDEDGDWNVETLTNCKHLDEETNKCMIYETRPQVCRDHGADECEIVEGEDFADVILRKPEDVDEYVKKISE
jgi:Fe-S-cluster containining protein